MRHALLVLVVLVVAGLAGCFHEAAPAVSGAGEPQGVRAFADVPTWTVGDTWTYASNRNTTVTLEVTGREVVDGADTYLVHRSSDGQTTRIRASDLNEVLPNGTAVSVFQFPLTDGATWETRTGDGRRGTAHAEWVTQAVTPYGLVDAFKITSSYPGGLVEVVHYAPALKYYARVDNYEQGVLGVSVALQSVALGGS